jgi:hypothetical protein
MEIFVLVPVRKSFLTAVLGGLFMALAIVCLLLGCSFPVTIYFAFIFGFLSYFFMFRSYKEYEYSYFDREVRFAKISNKSRRKSLGAYSMEDVTAIAPAGDRSVSRYETDTRVKVKDYTSRTKDTPYYEMVLQKDGDTFLFKLELDEPFLEAVEKQYKQKVIRM